MKSMLTHWRLMPFFLVGWMVGGEPSAGQAVVAGMDPLAGEGTVDSWTNILYINEAEPFNLGPGGPNQWGALKFRFWAGRFDGTVTPLIAEVVAPNEFIIRAIGTTRRGNGVDWVDTGVQEFAFKDGETPVIQNGWAVGFISSTPDGEEEGSPIPFVVADVEGWLTGTSSSGTGTPAIILNEPPVFGSSGTDTEAFGYRRYAFQITATPLDPLPPTSVLAHPPIIKAGLATGVAVTTLSAVDANVIDTHTFALVEGEGADDNSKFAIVGSQLRAAMALGSDGTRYSVRVRAVDGAGLAVEAIVELTVVGDKAPTQVRLDQTSILSLLPVGAVLGSFQVDDANLAQGDTHQFQLVSGAGSEDNQAFAIDVDQLILQSEPQIGKVYRLRVRATDSAGLFREEEISLPVLAVIGNSLEPRTSGAPTDTATVPIFYTNALPMPGPGTVTAVSIPLQSTTQLNLEFQIFQMRPTAAPDKYDVIAGSGPITVTGSVGELASFPLPNGPMTVAAGDLFFHYGRGIPFDTTGGNPRPIWYPCPVPPEAGEPLNLAAGHPDFPLRDDLQRDYAWAVHFTPGAPGGELRILDVSLQPATRMMTLTWSSTPGTEYRIRGSADLRQWDQNIETDIPAGPGATTTWNFGPVSLPGAAHYRVETNP